MEILAGFGIPQNEIAAALPSPYDTGESISPVTLRKHFREQLDTGIAKVKAKGAINLLRLSEKNAACAIFLAKTRLGLKETIKVEHGGKLQTTPTLTDEQMDRRILQLIQETKDTKQPGNRGSRAARRKA